MQTVNTDSAPLPVVEVQALSKQFGTVRALTGVDLQLRKGEVHGIIGENGAGKSTLMKILAGIERPTEGHVLVNGRVEKFTGVSHAQKLGIVMIHQELNLVDELSVAENIYLGREITRFGLLDRMAMIAQSRNYLASVSSAIDPGAMIRTLSIADRQIVEIAKALSCDASVLIMDEPTAVLTRREATALFGLIDRLRASGVTIVYISHILPEVLRVSDRITVLRDGKVVTTLDETRTKAARERDLASLMVGRPMAEYFPERHACRDKVVLSVSNLTVPGRVHNVSFDVREGEIFGLAGLIGAGRTEAAEAIAGLRRRTSGTIRLDGNGIAVASSSDAVRHRIAYLSEDRKGLGLTLGMNLAENMTLVSLPRYSKVLLSRSAQETAARTHIDRLRVRASGPRVICETLSGGNQQKVLLAKWLEIHPRVLLIDEPTRGVDIGAKEEIYRLLQQLGDQGMACVMISSEINELLGMCHRIGVMRAGRLIDILDGQAATEEAIMHVAAGVTAEAT